MGQDTFKPLSILVVDDDQAVARLLERLFEREGHQVDLAFTGGDGLALARRQRFDVCLIDKNLPDLTGVIVSQGVRELLPDSVIILLTGYASAGSAAELIGVADEYLTKPFELDQLRETIHTLLRRRATRPPPGDDAPVKGGPQVFGLVATPEDASLISLALGTLEVSFELGKELPMLAPSMVVMAASQASFGVRKAIWTWQTHARLRLVMIVDPSSVSDTIAAVALGATLRIKRPYDLRQAREVLQQALR